MNDIEKKTPSGTGRGAVPDAPPIDLDEAIERTMGDIEFLEELLHDFLNQLSQQIKTLESTLERGDAEGFMHEAHAIKGAAANLSAERIAAIARGLEEIGKEGDLTKGKDLLADLIDEAGRFESFVKESRWKESVSGD